MNNRTRLVIALIVITSGMLLERVGEAVYAAGWKQGVQDVSNAIQRQQAEHPGGTL